MLSPRISRHICPIDTSQYQIARDIDDYFLVVSRLNPYKRVDVIVRAFNELRLPLRIVGDGPERHRLEKMARSNIQFLGRVSDEVLRERYSRCEALIFAAEEDYGLVPLEAQASGRPVVAYGVGGVLETVIDSVTGRFFYEQTPESLARIIRQFDASEFDPLTIRQHALKFDKEVFKGKMLAFIREQYDEYAKSVAIR